MINLMDLSAKQFETLAGLLISSSGYKITRLPHLYQYRMPDYIAISPKGYQVFIEVKHYRHEISKRLLEDFAADIDRYRLQNENVHGLIITTGDIDLNTCSIPGRNKPIEIWNLRAIESILKDNPKIMDTFELIKDSETASTIELIKLISPTPKSTTAQSSKLSDIPCGRESWKTYETLGTKILTEIFTPELGPPDVQKRTEDNLEIMDAIFPIRDQNPPYSLIRAEFKSRFVVAEFKNHCKSITQREVESISQYLYGRAFRNFGLLVSRKSPSKNALAQRRKEWLEREKIIVFLRDQDLLEMLQMKNSGREPFDLINAQLEDFFRTLTS